MRPKNARKTLVKCILVESWDEVFVNVQPFGLLALSWEMPENPLCSKCRSWVRLPGDSWCVGCTASSELSLEFQRTWAAPLRQIGHDLVISTVRQLKALRAVSVGLQSRQASLAAKQAEASGADNRRAHRREEAASEGSREALPRRRTTTPKRAAKESKTKEEEQSTEESEGSLEEEEDRKAESPPPAGDHKSIRGDQRKPPEPDHPPPSRGRSRSRKRSDKQEGQAAKQPERKDHKKSKGHQPGRKKRAGRKHQRLYRLLEDPQKLVHQRLPESVWALQESLDASLLAQ